MMTGSDSERQKYKPDYPPYIQDVMGARGLKCGSELLSGMTEQHLQPLLLAFFNTLTIQLLFRLQLHRSQPFSHAGRF